MTLVVLMEIALGTSRVNIAVIDQAGVSPGSDGLRFLLYLAGEGTSHRDANAGGVFIG